MSTYLYLHNYIFTYQCIKNPILYISLFHFYSHIQRDIHIQNPNNPGMSEIYLIAFNLVITMIMMTIMMILITTIIIMIIIITCHMIIITSSLVAANDSVNKMLPRADHFVSNQGSSFQNGFGMLKVSLTFGHFPAFHWRNRWTHGIWSPFSLYPCAPFF